MAGRSSCRPMPPTSRIATEPGRCCGVAPSWPFVPIGLCRRRLPGPRVATASPIRVEIVRKPDDQVGFAVMPGRWVVERFFAWINRNRRLAKDVEATIASAEAFLYAASSILLLRRLAR